MLAGQRSAVASEADNNCNRLTFPTAVAAHGPRTAGSEQGPSTARRTSGGGRRSHVWVDMFIGTLMIP